MEQVRGLAGAARWNALPTLDVVGALGGNGLSGTGRDVIFGADTLRTSVRGGFSDTWAQVRERQLPDLERGARTHLSPSGCARGAANAIACEAM